MNKRPIKIEVRGKVYNLNNIDTINVPEKATVPEIPFVQWLRKMFKDIKEVSGILLKKQ